MRCFPSFLAWKKILRQRSIARVWLLPRCLVLSHCRSHVRSRLPARTCCSCSGTVWTTMSWVSGDPPVSAVAGAIAPVLRAVSPGRALRTRELSSSVECCPSLSGPIDQVSRGPATLVSREPRSHGGFSVRALRFLSPRSLTRAWSGAVVILTALSGDAAVLSSVHRKFR